MRFADEKNTVVVRIQQASKVRSDDNVIAQLSDGNVVSIGKGIVKRGTHEGFYSRYKPVEVVKTHHDLKWGKALKVTTRGEKFSGNNYHVNEVDFITEYEGKWHYADQVGAVDSDLGSWLE